MVELYVVQVYEKEEEEEVEVQEEMRLRRLCIVLNNVRSGTKIQIIKSNETRCSGVAR